MKTIGGIKSYIVGMEEIKHRYKDNGSFFFKIEVLLGISYVFIS